MNWWGKWSPFGCYGDLFRLVEMDVFIADCWKHRYASSARGKHESCKLAIMKTPILNLGDNPELFDLFSRLFEYKVLQLFGRDIVGLCLWTEKHCKSFKLQFWILWLEIYCILAYCFLISCWTSIVDIDLLCASDGWFLQNFQWKRCKWNWTKRKGEAYRTSYLQAKFR